MFSIYKNSILIYKYIFFIYKEELHIFQFKKKKYIFYNINIIVIINYLVI